MPGYGALPEELALELDRVEPSGTGEFKYRPCAVTLKSGQRVEAVYVAPEGPYIRMWGVYPENDKGKRAIRIEDVAEIRESELRLPARFADRVYAAGECGMGGNIFSVRFRNGQELTFIGGSVVDFIRYPLGLTMKDVVSVSSASRGAKDKIELPDYYFCLYSEERSDQL